MTGGVALPLEPVMLRLITIGLILNFAHSLFGQDSARFSHLVQLRLGVNQLRDENLHPKTSTGTLTELVYGIEKVNQRWQQFQFSLGYSRPRTELEDVAKTVNLRIHASYNYTYPLVWRTKVRYHLGPEAALAYTATFFPNWDDSHLYWANYLSVGIRNNLLVPMRHQKQWVTSLSLPLFSVFSRPELYRLYKIDDTSAGGIITSLHSNLSPAHLINVFYVKLNTEIRYPVFQHQTQAFSYRFEYLRVKDNSSAVFKQIIHQVGITFFL